MRDANVLVSGGTTTAAVAASPSAIARGGPLLKGRNDGTTTAPRQVALGEVKVGQEVLSLQVSPADGSGLKLVWTPVCFADGQRGAQAKFVRITYAPAFVDCVSTAVDSVCLSPDHLIYASVTGDGKDGNHDATPALKPARLVRVGDSLLLSAAVAAAEAPLSAVDSCVRVRVCRVELVVERSPTYILTAAGHFLANGVLVSCFHHAPTEWLLALPLRLSYLCGGGH